MVWLPVSERALKKALVRLALVFAVMLLSFCGRVRRQVD
jgi:hypothetical protein